MVTKLAKKAEDKVEVCPCPQCGQSRVCPPFCPVRTKSRIYRLCPPDRQTILLRNIYFLSVKDTDKKILLAVITVRKEKADLTTEFFMPMIPPTVTHQEHKVTVIKGKPVFYEPAELKEARSKLMANLAKHIPEKKYEHGVRLTVKWCFPIKGKHKDGEYKNTKPDTDNLQKLLKDCMTACGFWKDDALVASDICEKFYAKVTGIYVRIDEL